MSDIINLYFPHIIKVKAKRYKVSQYGSVQFECKKFTLNIQNTSYALLRIFLGRTFNIKGEFILSYRNTDRNFVPLTSDWDLDVALAESLNTYLYILIKPQPSEHVLDEWDIIGPGEIPVSESPPEKPSSNSNSLMGSLFEHMERTMVRVTRALSMESSPEGNCEKMPMIQTEFENFLDSDGRIVKLHEFHLTVYQGGVDPQLRPQVWKHLLNVYPEGMTSHERDVYLKSKIHEYYKLKKEWQKCVNEGIVCPDNLTNAMNLIRKDVRRTDRTEKFFAGDDDNKNIQALFNILTTFSANHPKLSYCQGMSDVLSPILYVMKDEAQAYICFCGLMKRVGSNFQSNGRSIKTKFRHLRKMLYYYDRELFTYLRSEEASDLLFTYRWLLLEMKREFVYTDALHLLEVLWGSLPPKPPVKELELYDVKFSFPDNSTKLQSSSTSLNNDDLLWINNYYCLSPKNTKTYFGIKVNEEERYDLQMQTLFEDDDSMEEAEIQLPIHYRRRKYRPYIARKLIMLSDSIPKKDTGITKAQNSIEICQSWASGEVFEKNPGKHNNAVLNAREFLRTQWCYSNTVNEIQLNNWLNGKRWSNTDHFNHSTIDTTRSRHVSSSDSNYSTNSDETTASCNSELDKEGTETKRSSRSEGYETESEDDYASDGSDYDDDEWCRKELADSMAGKKYEEAILYFKRKKELLPPPHVLGDGNPFLLFLCLSMIHQQRDTILSRNMDMNELCIFFDKMVRKHKLGPVLLKARSMFTEYLNMGWSDDIDDSEDDFDT